MATRPDLLLIHPGTNKKIYEALADEFAAIEPPFTAALTAGFARRKGYSVELIEANAEGLTHKETAERVKEINPKLAYIIVHGQQPSASSQMMGGVGELCKEIKGVTNMPLVLSSTHPSALPERTLREEEIDFVIRGEGFDSLTALLEGCEKEKVPGLCWLEGGKNGEFSFNPCGPLVEDLDKELGEVAWDLLPMDKYRAHNWHADFGTVEERKPYASMYTSLGCPFRCTYCCINGIFKASIADSDGTTAKILAAAKGPKEQELLRMLDNVKPRIRLWSPETVLKNIETLVEKYGVKHLKFIDEMYVLDREHVKQIANGIIEKGYDELNIWAYARVDTTKDEALLELIKKGGVNWLCLGIESANKEVRHGADKNFGNDAVLQSVKKVEKAGIKVLANFMVGLRNDTNESMKETMDMALYLNAPWFNLYATMAYPGAPDYGWAKEKGIPLPGDPGVPGGWTAYSHHSYFSLPLPTETLSAAEVLAFRDRAFDQYFRDSKYLARVKREFGDAAVEHIKKMTSHKIKRRILGDKTFEEYYNVK